MVVSFVADIKLDNATLLRSAFANNKFGQNIIDTPSNMAAEHNGIWAINGDHYGFRTTGIVIRNGVVYRDSGAREGFPFTATAPSSFYDETATNAQTLVNEGVEHSPSAPRWSRTCNRRRHRQRRGGHQLGNHSIQGNQPRTGVGVLGTNHLVFIVVDGRSTNYCVA